MIMAIAEIPPKAAVATHDTTGRQALASTKLQRDVDGRARKHHIGGETGGGVRVDGKSVAAPRTIGAAGSFSTANAT